VTKNRIEIFNSEKCTIFGAVAMIID